MNNKLDVEKVEAVEYWKVQKPPINIAHETGVLETVDRIVNEYETVQDKGSKDHKTEMENKLEEQLTKRKQIMKKLHKEICELEKLQ